MVAAMGPDDLLQQQARSQQLFGQAVRRVKAGTAPSDEIALEVCCSSCYAHTVASTGSLLRR